MKNLNLIHTFTVTFLVPGVTQYTKKMTIGITGNGIGADETKLANRLDKTGIQYSIW